MKAIVIRADFSNKIGMGHIIRTIALGQRLQDAGHKVHYVTIPRNNFLPGSLEQENFQLHLLPDTSDWNPIKDVKSLLTIANKHKATWVITDGYHFKTDYQKEIKRNGQKLMCIDDIAECHYCADVVLNQNAHAVDLNYSAENFTKFFLGPRYSLIRREIEDAAAGFQRNIKGEAHNILVMMGGADENNVTLKILKALELVQNLPLNIKIILGPLNQFHDEIRAFAKLSKHTMEVFFNIGDEICEHMKRADLAVSAGGSALWEFGLFATPVLAFIVAHNQEPIVKKLSSLKAVVSAGWHDRVDQKKISHHIGSICKNHAIRATLSKNLYKTVTPRKTKKVVQIFGQ